MILYKYLIYAINRHALDVDICTYIYTYIIQYHISLLFTLKSIHVSIEKQHRTPAPGGSEPPLAKCCRITERTAPDMVPATRHKAWLSNQPKAVEIQGFHQEKHGKTGENGRKIHR